MNAKDRRSTGSLNSSLAGVSIVKALAELGAHRGRQLIDALEMIVERSLRDACRVDNSIHRERFGGALREQNRSCLDELRARLPRRSRPISALRAKSTFAICTAFFALRHRILILTI